MEKKLTESQKKAINTLDKNLQIIACAGSGKTEVISRRIIELIKQKKAEPKNIVAFTYTEKAAAELKHRVINLYKKEFGNIRNFAEMYIGTMHSWCLNFLKDNIFGYQKYEIIDDVKRKIFINKYYYNSGMNRIYHLQHKEPMKRYSQTKYFLQIIDLLREEETKNLPDYIIRAMNDYETLLKSHNFMDFTMILKTFYELLNGKKNLPEEKRLQSLIEKNVKYLIIDEYQDINPIQEKIIEKIYNLNTNLCVVGDDDQTIYQWRGSNVKNILNFANKYKNVKQIKLEENFRSSEKVLEAAQKIIDKIPKNNRLSKKMIYSSHIKWEEGDIAVNKFTSIEEEAEFIKDKIKELHGTIFKDAPKKERGLDYSDMCILVRNWKTAENYIKILKEAEIPYIVKGLDKVFDEEIIKACVNIYKFLKNDIKDTDLETSWKSIIINNENLNFKKAIEELEKVKLKIKKDEWYEMFNLQKIYRDFLENLSLKEKNFGNKGELAFFLLGKFSQVIHDFESIHFTDKPPQKLANFLNFLKYQAKDEYYGIEV